ncbi:MAG: hypothetical protein JSR77_05220 [Planctomycetes bacterium]|nr:hypothetical protein [Planctomycetota bacterium]
MTPTTPRKSRWRRRFVGSAVALLALSATYFILTSSWVVGKIVLSGLGSSLGGTATADSVSWGYDGTVTLTHPRVRAPGVPSEAGTVFQADRVHANFSFRALFAGKQPVTSVTLDSPILRISQSADDGSINLAALTPARGNATGRPATTAGEIPALTLRGGIIELGEHLTQPSAHPGQPVYTALRRLNVDGDVIQAPGADGESVISFRQTQGPGVPASGGGLSVEGRVSHEGVTLNVSGIKLSDLSADAVPSRIRENFRQLRLTGETSAASFAYYFSGGYEATLGLADVSVTLPIAAAPYEDDDGNMVPLPPGAEGKLLRMEHVHGVTTFSDKGATAKLEGRIADLPYTVDITVSGSDAESPFTCRLTTKAFELKEHPEIVLFAPGIVRKRLKQFSNPTGLVDADVTLTRASKSGEITVQGTLDLKNGTAAFERFPYQFQNVSAHAVFDESRLVLDPITGEAPGGVRLNATTVVGPLTDDAGVDVKVSVTNLPVDDRLREALKNRGKIVTELFNKEAYERLVAEGLVISPARAEELKRQLAALRAIPRPSDDEQKLAIQTGAALEAPVFEPGGIATVNVGVQRKVGPESIWNDQVSVHFEKVAVIPEAFPFPMVGADVTMAKNDFEVTVSGGLYHGLRGGEARIAAKADLEKFDDPQAPFVPDVEISGIGVPMDPLLLFAIPSAENLSPNGRPLRELISRMNISGKGNADAKVYLLPDGRPGYDIKINLAGALASPHAPNAQARLSLSEITGSVDIGQDALAIDLRLLAATAGADPAQSPSPAHVKSQVRYGKGAETGTKVDLDATSKGADAGLNVEDMVAMFSPEAAETIGTYRSNYQLGGKADIEFHLSNAADGHGTQFYADIAHLKSLAFDAAGARVSLDSERGLVRLTQANSASTMDFREFETAMSCNGSPAGRVAANGMISTSGGPAGDSSFFLSLTGSQLASPAIRGGLRNFGPVAISEWVTAANASGVFDLSLSLTPKADSPLTWSTSGAFTPHTFAATMNKVPVSTSISAGAIEFNDNAGSVRGLLVEAPAWKARLDGGWTRSRAGEVAAQTTVGIDAASLTPDLRELLPQAVRDLLASLAVNCGGPVKSDNASLSFVVDGSGNLQAFKTGGTVAVHGMNLDPGIAITQCIGAIDFSAQRASAAAPIEFQVLGQSEVLAAAGVSMGNARIRFDSGPDGEVLIPHISADCHGGRVTGSGTIRGGERSPREFEVQLKGSNIRFASVMSDWQKSRKQPVTPDPSPDPHAADESRGVLDFGLTLGGEVNKPDTRRGRGTASVAGGRVMSIPMVVPLVRVSNLELPLDEKMDFAQADFFFRGQRIEFERAWISSPGVEIYGFGAAMWPDMAIDLRVRTKARNRIPIISGVMESIRNELVTARVSGTLGDPVVTVESLGGTTRLVKGLFGDEPTDQERRLQQIADMAARDPRHSREAKSDPPATAPK